MCLRDYLKPGKTVGARKRTARVGRLTADSKSAEADSGQQDCGG